MRVLMADQQMDLQACILPLFIRTRINPFLYFNEQRPGRKFDRAVKGVPGK